MLELARSLPLARERGCLIPHGVLFRIAKRIELAQSLGEEPAVFSESYVGMVAAG